MKLFDRQEWISNIQADVLAGAVVALALIPEAIAFSIQIIFPYAIALSMVGLLESFLTANVVDELTDTSSNKNQEAFGQGLANVVTGFFGGMAGCAMIGQSVINVQSGGRTRLSTLSAGVLLPSHRRFGGCGS